MFIFRQGEKIAIIFKDKMTKQVKKVIDISKILQKTCLFSSSNNESIAIKSPTKQISNIA